MKDKIEELLDMSDPITKSHYMIWDNGEYYDTDYDQIKLRYQNKDE